MKTLIHFGVFINKYEPVGLEIKYKKKVLKLSPVAEQMAIAWVRKLETPYVNDPVFVSNFTRSLVEEIRNNKEYILEKTAKITDFDFSSIKDHIQKVKAKKEGMSKEERKLDLVQRKEVREKLKDKYGYAFIDGRQIPLQNYFLEPASIFLSKGLNSQRGRWKRTILESDVTLNLSPDAFIPKIEVLLSKMARLKYLDENDPIWGKAICLLKILLKEENTKKLGVVGNVNCLNKILELMKLIFRNKENMAKEVELNEERIQKDLKSLCKKKEKGRKDIGEKIKVECKRNSKNGIKVSNLIQISWPNIGKIVLEDQDGVSFRKSLNSLLQEVEDVKDVDLLILEFWNFITRFNSIENLNMKDLGIGEIQKNPKDFKSFVLTAILLFTSLDVSIRFPWKEIIWDPKALWIAKWSDVLDPDRTKYVWLAQSTQLRQEKEQKKFELALKLQDDLDRLEVIIDRELDEGTLERRKIAMVVYLMKNLALRVGDEKIAGEFGTVGCTTLKKENVRLEGNTLHLSFKGKDYVQWDKSMVLPKLVKENLKEFLDKAGNDFIFKGINSEKTASFLRETTPGVSAKVFRTCIAGKTWEEHARVNLNMIHRETSDEIKKYLFKMTNLEVAKKLNHKRALPKGYDERKERIRLKLEEESNKLKEMYSKEADSVKTAAQERKTEKLAVSWDLITNTAEWNLGTSLNAYISPEKVMRFVEESELEPEDVYSKALQEKYSWAIKGKES